MNKADVEIVNGIRERILAEQRKHPELDWAHHAALKIFAAHKKRLSTEVVMPEVITKEMMMSRDHYCTVGRLKEHIAEHNLPDHAPVVVQRVEDTYYENNGWSVYTKEGEHWHHCVNFNRLMKAEIARRERGEEREFSMEVPQNYIVEDSAYLETTKDQYTVAWCPVFYKDDADILFIDLHY